MDVGLTTCAREGCENSFKPHHWGTKEASRNGWFHQRNGDSWCPEHIPEWVESWRKKQAEKEEKRAEKIKQAKEKEAMADPDRIYATFPVFVEGKKVGFGHIRADGRIQIEPFYHELLVERAIALFSSNLSEGFTVGLTMTPARPKITNSPRPKTHPGSEWIVKGVN